MTPATTTSSSRKFKLSASTAFTDFNIQNKLLTNLKKLPNEQRNYFILVLELFDLIKSNTSETQFFSVEGDISNLEIEWRIQSPSPKTENMKFAISKDRLAKFFSLYLPELKGRHGPDYLDVVEYLFSGEISRDILSEISREILAGARKSLSIIGEELFHIPQSSNKEKSYTYYNNLSGEEKVVYSNLPKMFVNALGLKNYAGALMNEFQNIASHIYGTSFVKEPSEAYKSINSFIGFIYFDTFVNKDMSMLQIDFEQLNLDSITQKDASELDEKLSNVLCADTSRINLDQAHIKVIDLTNKLITDLCINNSDLSGARFENCILFNFRLANINLSNAVLNNVFICDSSFHDVDLTGAKLTNVVFQRCHIHNVNFSQAKQHQNIKIYNLPIFMDESSRLPDNLWLMHYTFQPDKIDYLNLMMSIKESQLKINLALAHIQNLSKYIFPHYKKLDQRRFANILRDLTTCLTSDQVFIENDKIRQVVIENLYAKELAIFTIGEVSQIIQNISWLINNSNKFIAERFLKFLNIILCEVTLNPLAYQIRYKRNIDAVIKLAKNHTNQEFKALGHRFSKICIEPRIIRKNRFTDVTIQFADNGYSKSSDYEVPSPLPSLLLEKPEPLLRPNQQVVQIYA